MAREQRSISVTFAGSGEDPALSSEAAFVAQLLAMLAEMTDSRENLHGQIWVLGEVSKDVLLSAIASCMGSHQETRIYIPTLSAGDPKPKLVTHWFTADLPRGERAASFVRNVDWEDNSIVMLAAIYPQSQISQCWDRSWEPVRHRILDELDEEMALFMEGYFDTDIFRFSMTTATEVLMRRSLSHRPSLLTCSAD